MFKTCGECEQMACKVYTSEKEEWTGFCLRLGRKVKGKDKCREPLLELTLD